MNQGKNKDDTGRFDDEIPEHNFTEFFQSLEEPGNIKQDSNDVQCLVPVNEMVSCKTGNDNLIGKQTESYQQNTN